MKKIIAYFTLGILLTAGILSPQTSLAEESVDTSVVIALALDADTTIAALQEMEEQEMILGNDEPGFTENIKDFFIDGGIGFMIIILLCLIIGVSIAIERIIYLSLATVNHKKLLEEVEDALNRGGIEAAKAVCQDTRGPVGSIFYDGLTRAEEGPEVVERAIISGGSVQLGLMEKGTSWISLFISLAPMLGFLGTVLGMIDSFDAIEEAGGIKPTVVAGGIKTALITTVAGLVVAIILQVFHNFIVAKIDNLTNAMEDASNTFVKLVKTKLG
jgi:biopolymer transport protein ExbB